MNEARQEIPTLSEAGEASPQGEVQAEEDTGLEVLASGLRGSRGADGRLEKVELSSDRARLMSALSRESRKSAGAEEVSAVLIAALDGSPDATTAAQHVLLEALSRVIVRGGSASVSAIKDAATALSIAWNSSKVPEVGQKCVRCGEVRGKTVPVIQLCAAASFYASGLLREYEPSAEETAEFRRLWGRFHPDEPWQTNADHTGN